MTRKRTRRKVWLPMAPKGLRAPLFAETRSALAIAHMQNLDLISRGTASQDEVWHLVEQALTWSRVAQLLGQGEPEMAEQVTVATQVVQRFQRTGRVGFSGTEYQAAKFGLDVMDELARLVDQPKASQAAAWSEAQVAGLRLDTESSRHPLECQQARRTVGDSLDHPVGPLAGA